MKPCSWLFAQAGRFRVFGGAVLRAPLLLEAPKALHSTRSHFG